MSVEVKGSWDIDWTLRRDGGLSARAEVQQVFLILLSREALWQVRIPSHSASLASKRDNSSLLFCRSEIWVLCFCCLPSPFMAMFHCTQNQWASRFLHGYLYLIVQNTSFVFSLSTAALWNWKLATADVTGAFLRKIMIHRLYFRIRVSSSSSSSSYYYYYYHHHHLLYAGYLYVYSWEKLCP